MGLNSYTFPHLCHITCRFSFTLYAHWLYRTNDLMVSFEQSIQYINCMVLMHQIMMVTNFGLSLSLITEILGVGRDDSRSCFLRLISFLWSQRSQIRMSLVLLLFFTWRVLHLDWERGRMGKQDETATTWKQYTWSLFLLCSYYHMSMHKICLSVCLYVYS